MDSLIQPVNGYEYLVGQVINGLLSNTNIPSNYMNDDSKIEWIVNKAIDITTKLIIENDKRYDVKNK